MREIIFDTETTGLDPLEDRVIEIGGVELVNRFPSGRSIHFYIHPGDRQIHPEAQAVHGISLTDLAGKPRFAEIVEEFLAFIDGAKLVAFFGESKIRKVSLFGDRRCCRPLATHTPSR